MFILDTVMSHLSRNKVTVLAFHKTPLLPDPVVPLEPDLRAFERIVDFIAERFRIISLEEALSSFARRTSLPSASGAACLTFDDGYVDWLNGVVPLLQGRNLPAAFFITTGQLDGMPLWHERIRWAVQTARDTVLDVSLPAPTPVPVPTARERIQVTARIESALKYQALGAREQLIAALEAHAGADPKGMPRLMPRQVRELHDAGFEIGTHTVNHPILSCCDAAQAKHEIGSAKETLEGLIGNRVSYFAYPNGRRRDYGPAHVDQAMAAGYTCAFTTEAGAWTGRSPVFEIPRFTPWGPNPARIGLQMTRNLLRQQ